jgi:MOSC domain-containing protein YiiM
MFGENFTTEGLLEETVNIGDRFRIGFVSTLGKTTIAHGANQAADSKSE